MPALHTANESGALTAALVILIWALVVLLLFGAIVWWQAHPGTRPARIEHWNLLSERRPEATAVLNGRSDATMVLNKHLKESAAARTTVLPRVSAQRPRTVAARDAEAEPEPSTSMTSSARPAGNAA
jgi:hypothetical protein